MIDDYLSSHTFLLKQSGVSINFLGITTKQPKSTRVTCVICLGGVLINSHTPRRLVGTPSEINRGETLPAIMYT